MLSKLTLKNFRCFSSKQISFSKKFNLILGRNAAGKTSLLEALYYASYSSSFRTKLRSDLIREGEKETFLSVEIESEKEPCSIKIGFNDIKKVIRLGSEVIKTHKDLYKRLSCALLRQEDIELVVGSPSKRRSFLDQAMLIKNPDSVDRTKKVKRILENRVRLFFKENPSEDELKYWTKVLWQESLEVQKERIEIIKDLNLSLEKILQNGEEISTSFFPRKSLKESNFEEFWSTWKKKELFEEKKYKRNLLGPQTDDFEIFFNKKNAKKFASRGQQKFICFCLKISMAKLSKKPESEKVQIILIDDFFTEMDEARVKDCASILKKENIQTVITEPTLNFKILKDALEPNEIKI